MGRGPGQGVPQAPGAGAFNALHQDRTRRGRQALDLSDADQARRVRPAACSRPSSRCSPGRSVSRRRTWSCWCRACLLPRCLEYYRQLRGRPVRTPKNLRRMPHHAAASVR
ncbi:cytochrome c biogenesis protein ResB [Saccharopolyspora shandongensis]|uniref:cytochrome c biogenesis protein ResB n=1 Tax=Saccharopolyspora shandongensis TaxID=418495 RepID=UPI0033D80171